MSFLLHGLAKVTTENFRCETAKHVFAIPNTKIAVLFGPSGSGKTFALYDLLASTYGLFLTCSTKGNGGDILMQHLANCDFAGGDRAQNSFLVRAMTLVVVSVYTGCLKEYLSGDKPRTPYQWFIYHCYSEKACSFSDQKAKFFNNCISALRRIDSKRLISMFSTFSDNIRVDLGGIKTPFSIVLDEVQILFSDDKRFLSHTLTISPDDDTGQLKLDSKPEPRHRFTPIMAALNEINERDHSHIFIAGTGMHFSDLKDSASAVLKNPVPIVINFGGIYNVPSLCAYMNSISKSLSDFFLSSTKQLIIDRLGGRYRPLALFLTDVLKSQPQSIYSLNTKFVAAKILSDAKRMESAIKHNFNSLTSTSPMKNMKRNLCQLALKYLCGRQNTAATLNGSAFLVTLGVSRLYDRDGSITTLLSEIDDDTSVMVSITEPCVATAVQASWPNLMEAEVATEILNAQGTSFGNVFENIIVYRLHLCLDRTHIFHQRLFGPCFTTLTGLSNVQLCRGKRSSPRLVCTSADVFLDKGDVITHFLDTLPAPFLYPEPSAGPDIVCMLTATNTSGERVDIPMFIQCKLVEKVDNWDGVWQSVSPEELYTKKVAGNAQRQPYKNVRRSKLQKYFPTRDCLFEPKYPFVIRAVVVFTPTNIDHSLPLLASIEEDEASFYEINSSGNRQLVIEPPKYVRNAGKSKQILLTLVRRSSGPNGNPFRDLLGAEIYKALQKLHVRCSLCG